MTKIMNASSARPMTDGQIEDAVNKLRDAMRKHRIEIKSDVAQQVLGRDNIGMSMFEPFRNFAQTINDIVVRRVKVNRLRTPSEALSAVGFAQYIEPRAVDSMPRGDGDEVDVVFFKPDLSGCNGFLSDDDLDREFGFWGLRPADPYSMFAVNEADKYFVDKIPHVTHWKDSSGCWCFAMLNNWEEDGRRVDVLHNPGDGQGIWNEGWWLAGMYQ